MKHLIIKKKVTFKLNDAEMDKMFRMSNKYFTGNLVVPYGQEVSEAHKNAHWSINAVHQVDITVKIYEDGSWEIV